LSPECFLFLLAAIFLQPGAKYKSVAPENSLQQIAGFRQFVAGCFSRGNMLIPAQGQSTTADQGQQGATHLQQAAPPAAETGQYH
jgi:hypothetical protein